jgi:methionyl-tRNA formyltransferase
MKPNVIFMGTPEFSVPVLEELNKIANILLVVTQPDKPVGRKQELRPTPVKVRAEELDLNISQPERLREITDELEELSPDFIITCAYGQIVPKEILDIPNFLPINVHASLLPKYRGAAPIQRAIMNGDEKTGITIMVMEEGLDTGPILSMQDLAISKYDNLGVVHDNLSILGADLLAETLPLLFDDTITPVPQDTELVTIAPKITKDDELIDWNNQTIDVYNHIRALNPVPGAYTVINDKEFKIFEVDYQILESTESPGTITNITKDNFSITTADGHIIIKTLQLSGKNKTDAKTFINGYLK